MVDAEYDFNKNIWSSHSAGQISMYEWGINERKGYRYTLRDVFFVVAVNGTWQLPVLGSTNHLAQYGYYFGCEDDNLIFRAPVNSTIEYSESFCRNRNSSIGRITNSENINKFGSVTQALKINKTEIEEIILWFGTKRIRTRVYHAYYTVRAID